jgi:hypothetical protein
MKGKRIRVLDVKCDDDKNLQICSQQDIPGYPTVRLIWRDYNGQIHTKDYEGNRTVTDLIKFVYDNIEETTDNSDSI